MGCVCVSLINSKWNGQIVYSILWDLRGYEGNQSKEWRGKFQEKPIHPNTRKSDDVWFLRLLATKCFLSHLLFHINSKSITRWNAQSINVQPLAIWSICQSIPLYYCSEVLLVMSWIPKWKHKEAKILFTLYNKVAFKEKFCHETLDITDWKVLNSA